MTQITIKSDGGARGNPGPAAIGFVVYLNQELVKSYKQRIEDTTNNVAEYKAIIKALSWVRQNLEQLQRDNPIQIECLLDSKLVVNQLKGEFKIKQPHLKELANTAFNIISQLGVNVEFRHIRREFNQEPDQLLNSALDESL